MRRIKNILGDNIGYVQLLDYMGTDFTVVNAARVTYNRESVRWSDADTQLIHTMMDNHHGTPFEHIVLTYRVRAPLFVRSQWERHRIASYNETSGRRHKMEPEFYAPDAMTQDDSTQAYGMYLRRLDYYRGQGLADGRAKELARLMLPVNLYTTFWFTVNGRSVMNFMMLRNSMEAQEEIRKYGQAVEDIFADLYPVTYDAFIQHGRAAP